MRSTHVLSVEVL
jgi:hypothetical protein